jgi:Xaa-Pro aminopeptidase
MSINLASMEKVLAVIDEYKNKVDITVNIPLAEYHDRYQKVWRELDKRHIDLGFFFWYREMPGDGLYLTGYNPTVERASGVIAPGKPPMLLVGPESGILSREVGLNLETYFVTEFSIPDEFYEGVASVSLTEVIQNYAGKKISTIACLTPFDIVPVKFYEVLANDISAGATVIEAADILADLRFEKSRNEFLCMKQANTIANAAMRAMLAVSAPGMRELEIAAVGDFVMKELGSNGYGVETMVMSGGRCRSVIGPATNKIISRGELVHLGCSPSYEGYKGVCRRAFVMGGRNPAQDEYFRIMRNGFDIAVKELQNVVEHDLPINRIDLAPRQYFATETLEGVNAKNLHFFSTCHGTGLTECLEKMVVHPYKEDYYGQDVGIMMDLGLYGHPDDRICGASIENAFFKKGNKLISFTDVPADVQEMTGMI